MDNHTCPDFTAIRTIGDLTNNAEQGCTRCLMLSKVFDKMGRRNLEICFSERQYRGGSSPIETTIWHLLYRGTIDKEIETFAEHDSDKILPELPYRRIVEDTSSADSLERAQEWLRFCSVNHEHCGQSDSSYLPTRVVDVEGEAVKLIESKLIEPKIKDRRYIALSHCWGGSHSDSITTVSTIARNKSGIPLKTLPDTFRDVIEVTKKLGVRYLWIDSLCIIQADKNDPDPEISRKDWEEESSKMASVYRNAYLTICAAVGQSDDAGLWPRDAPKIIDKVVMEDAGKQYKVYFRDMEETKALHMSLGVLTTAVDKRMEKMFPLITRGWTLQERLLSPRLLYYGHGELLWQCRQLNSCECCFNNSGGSSYMAGWDVTEAFRDMVASGRSKDEIAQNWRLLVEHYSHLNLTKPNDVLPAISALATVCSEVRREDSYLAGLWDNSIVEDMCWSVRGKGPGRARPDYWRAPTYSWASIRERVTYKLRETLHAKTTKLYAQLVGFSTVLAGPDPMGQVLSGYVKIKGPVQEASFENVKGGFCMVTANSKSYRGIPDSITDFEKGLIKDGAAVLCLRLRILGLGRGEPTMPEDQILLLVAIEGEGDIYQRVGMVQELTYRVNEHWFLEGGYEREVEIR